MKEEPVVIYYCLSVCLSVSVYCMYVSLTLSVHLSLCLEKTDFKGEYHGMKEEPVVSTSLVCLYVCMYVWPSIWSSVCLSVSILLCVSVCGKQGHRFKKIVLSIYLVVVIILGIIMVIAVAAG